MIVVLKIGVSLSFMNPFTRLSRDRKKHDVAGRANGSARDLH